MMPGNEKELTVQGFNRSRARWSGALVVCAALIVAVPAMAQPFDNYKDHGDWIASLPKGTDTAGLERQQAVTILNERGKKPKRRKRRKR